MGEKYGKLGRARLLRTVNGMVKSWILCGRYWGRIFKFFNKKDHLFCSRIWDQKQLGRAGSCLFHTGSAAAYWLRYMYQAGKLVLAIGWEFSCGFCLGLSVLLHVGLPHSMVAGFQEQIFQT